MQNSSISSICLMLKRKIFSTNTFFFLAPGLSSRTGFTMALLKRISAFRFLHLGNSNIYP